MLNQVQTNVANSQNGGPLTDNVVLSSDQRVFDFKRTAVSKFEIPHKSIVG